MMQIEKTSDSEFYTAMMEGKSREVVFYEDSDGKWWVGFEDGPVSDDQEVGGFLGAQAVALELLNSLAG
jgi:hypothetical protein